MDREQHTRNARLFNFAEFDPAKHVEDICLRDKDYHLYLTGMQQSSSPEHVPKGYMCLQPTGLMPTEP